MNANFTSQIIASDSRLLNINKAAEYLVKRGWFEKKGVGRGLVRVFEYQSNKLIQARFPAIADLDDYEKVTIEGLETVAEQERRSFAALFNDILFFSDDVLEIREAATESLNGTISLRRAGDMLSGIKSSLASAAMLEIEPKPFYVKQQRADVTTFISQCRFGQTQRGSYIMTVSCPLNAMPQQSRLNENTLFEPNFSRRITARLYNSIALLVQAASDDNLELVIKIDDNATMLSSNFCDAVLQLMPGSEGARLDFGVRWAKKQPFDNEKESTNYLSILKEYTPFIESVSSQLRLKATTVVVQNFFGTISTLDGRMDEDGRRYGPIIVHLTNREEGDTVTAKIDLSQEDFAKAYEIYDKMDKFISVSGILKRSTSGNKIESYTNFRTYSV